MEFFELKKELDSNKRRKVYFLTGEEKGLRDKYVDRICVNAPIKTNSFTSVKSRFLSKDLFSGGSKYYVIDNDKEFINYTGDMKALEKLIGNNTVVFLYDNLDMRSNFFKYYAEQFFHFNRLNSEQLCNYVQTNLEIKKDLAIIFSGYCKNDFNTIENEMDKLKNLNIPITFEILNELIEEVYMETDFSFLDHVAKRNIKKSLEFTNNVKSSDVLKYVGSLYSRFRSIFAVQTYAYLNNIEVAGKTGLTLFVVDKLRANLEYYSFEELIRNLRYIQQTEVAIKTGRIDPLIAFHYLICRILSKNLRNF